MFNVQRSTRNFQRNLCLIGMPGSGKSVLGRVLGRRMGRKFLDGDHLIEKDRGRPLAQILKALGSRGFLGLENRVLRAVKARGVVLAPGGSVVLSAKIMSHLRKTSHVVYLRVGLKELKRRLGNIRARGVVGAGRGGLDEVYRRRRPLYGKYAHVTIHNLRRARTLKLLEEIARELWGLDEKRKR